MDSTSLSPQASGDEPDLTCGPCDKNLRKIRPAVAYCTVCNTYLCRLCQESHMYQRIFRSHKLLRGEDMYLTNRTNIHQELGCRAHPWHLLERYCKFHDSPVCRQCLDTVHKRCRDIRELREAAANVTEEYPQTVEKVKDLLHFMKDLQNKHENTRVNIRNHREVAIRHIKRMKEELEDILERLESDLIDEVELTFKSENTLVTGHIEKCAESVPLLESLLLSLQNAYKSQIKTHMYLAAKRADLESGRLKQITVDVKAHLYNTQIKFRQNEKAYQFIKKLEKLGSIEVEKSHLNPSTNSSITDDLVEDVPKTTGVRSLASNFTKIRFSGKYNVRFEGDKQNCYVVGMAIAPNGHLLIADKANSRVKELDPNLFRLSVTDLPSRPYAIAAIDEERAVVTLPQIKQLQFVSLRPSLKLERSLMMEARFNTVTHFQQKLVVCCSSLIQIIDLKGMVLKRISFKEGAESAPIVKTPQSIVMNATFTRLYIGDWEKGIVCLIREGDHLFTYTDSEMKNVVGISRDLHGYIYATGCNSFSINIINENGVRIGELSTKPRVLEGPRAIIHDDRRQRLIVSFGKDIQTGFDHIAVYQ